jgi:hypothetical protein
VNRLLVCYDLVGAERSDDYRRLTDRIRQYGTFASLQYSTWIVVTPVSARALRDDLRAYLDADDRLFVAAMTGETAWQNMPGDVKGWMRRYMG